MATKFTTKAPITAKLREYILSDFQTYGLTEEDLDFWWEDAEAVGKPEAYEATLREVIAEGSDWGMSE